MDCSCLKIRIGQEFKSPKNTSTFSLEEKVSLYLCVMRADGIGIIFVIADLHMLICYNGYDYWR